MDEWELLKRAGEYDQDALSEIHTRYYRQLYDHIYRWTGDRALAEDLTTDVFVQFLETVTAGNVQASLRILLYQIAGNLVVEHQRRQPQPDTVPENAGHATLRHAIRQLPADQQQVFILKLLEDWSNGEIAQVLSVTESEIKELQYGALLAFSRART